MVVIQINHAHKSIYTFFCQPADVRFLAGLFCQSADFFIQFIGTLLFFLFCPYAILQCDKFFRKDLFLFYAGVSGDTIRNYIALTQLVPELQQMVDEKKIALSPAYQIAALTPKEQGLLLETIDSEQATPSLSQAQRMKKLSQSGELNEDTIDHNVLRHEYLYKLCTIP